MGNTFNGNNFIFIWDNTLNREQLKKIDRFLTFGDIKPKVDETDCYYITDEAMQKVIRGYEEEILMLKRKIIYDRLSPRES